MSIPKPDPTPPTIAARLTLAREARGMSMNALTVAAHLSGAAVHFIENHPGSDARVNTMLALAKGLDVHPAWLAFGLGEMGSFPAELADFDRPRGIIQRLEYVPPPPPPQRNPRTKK